jgi:putative acetyltransferase
MKTDILITHIRSSSRAIVRQFGLLDNRFSSIGSTSQCHALVELDSHGVMNLNQLSAVLNLEKSTTSRLVTQLLDKGICHIQADEHDRRNKLISLSKKGLQLVNRIHCEAKLQVQQALDMMSEEEKNTVVRGLSIYAKALKRSSMQQEYTIRQFHKNDVPQLINLIKTVWAEFGFDSSHPAAPLFESELNKTYETYSINKSNYFVLMHGKKIVGGAGFGPLPKGYEDTCELKGMYLSSQLRGSGLGATLLQKVLQEVKNEGFKKCYLETMDFMHGANALYQKFGFTKLDNPIGNTGHAWTNCFYIKEIEPTRRLQR